MPFRKHGTRSPLFVRFAARFLPHAHSRRNPPSVHLLPAVSTLPPPSLALSSPFSIPRVLFPNIEIDLV